MRSPIRLWAMAIDGLEEDDVAGWRDVLDDAERARVDRLAVARSRVEYIAAHALTRRVLGETLGEAPSAFHYEAGAKGKPVALVAGRPAGVHFNLSHTNGLVAIAVSRLGEVGVDAEAVDRNVNLAVADRYFFGAESRWLAGLAPAARAEGFLRLWTLKEAYIKATGLGLSQPLDEFWFEVDPPRIRFHAGDRRTTRRRGGSTSACWSAASWWPSAGVPLPGTAGCRKSSCWNRPTCRSDGLARGGVSL